MQSRTEKTKSKEGGEAYGWPYVEWIHATGSVGHALVLCGIKIYLFILTDSYSSCAIYVLIDILISL